MKVTVKKSELKGTANVPPSKSQTIRGLMCAALARGESDIINPLVCEDTEAAAGVLEKVGIRIEREEKLWRVYGGTFREPKEDLHCGESATTMRFMTAICALIPGNSRLVGGPSLTERPVKSLTEALKKLKVGVSIEGKKTPPVNIEGGTLRGGPTEMPGNISSQFISALLLIAPFAEKEVSIRLTTPMTSRPYVLMTLRALRQFGIKVRADFDKFVISPQKYRPARFKVEADWSSASYLLSLGMFSEGIEVDNLSTSSLQGDRVILELLRGMGAQVSINQGRVIVSRSDLQAASADFTDCIDLLPTMGVMAALADGASELTGIERARIKESNRVAAVREGLNKLGVTATEDRDRLTILGLNTPEEKSDDDDDEEKPAEVTEEAEPENVVIDSRNDHRIAMAFSIFGAARGNVTITGAECVAKTFPDYWETLKSLGGEVTIEDE